MYTLWNGSRCNRFFCLFFNHENIVSSYLIFSFKILCPVIHAFSSSLPLHICLLPIRIAFNQKDNKCQIRQVVKQSQRKTSWIHQYSCHPGMLVFTSLNHLPKQTSCSFCCITWDDLHFFFQFIWHMCTEPYPQSRKSNCQKLPIITKPLNTYILRINSVCLCGITGL